MKTNDQRLSKAIDHEINYKVKEDFVLMSGFSKPHHLKTGALSTKHKEIITLAIAFDTDFNSKSTINRIFF